MRDHIVGHGSETIAAMISASSPLGSLLVCVAIASACAPTSSLCLEQNKATPGKPADVKGAQADIQQFCANNAAVIGDARIVWQTSKLIELESRVRKQLTELEARKAEYVEWLRKRSDALKLATDNIVAIYAHMRPDAAALQIAAMDEAVAAAILAKLSARVASAVFNEMEVGQAARLSHMMVGPNTASDGKKS